MGEKGYFFKWKLSQKNSQLMFSHLNIIKFPFLFNLKNKKSLLKTADKKIHFLLCFTSV